MPYARRPKELMYNVWRSMMRRCYEPSRRDYKDYGGRGIVVHEPWHDLETFRSWLTEQNWQHGLQLDRIDNDGPYSPDNCQFLTPKANSRKRRSSVMVTAFMETKSLVEWSEDSRCVISYQRLWRRISLGHDAESAMTTPSRKWVRHEHI